MSSKKWNTVKLLSKNSVQKGGSKWLYSEKHLTNTMSARWSRLNFNSDKLCYWFISFLCCDEYGILSVWFSSQDHRSSVSLFVWVVTAKYHKLEKNKFISHSSEGWAVQDHGIGIFSVCWEPTFWFIKWTYFSSVCIW